MPPYKFHNRSRLSNSDIASSVAQKYRLGNAGLIKALSNTRVLSSSDPVTALARKYSADRLGEDKFTKVLLGKRPGLRTTVPAPDLDRLFKGLRESRQPQPAAWQNSPLGRVWQYGIKPAIGAIQRSYNQRNPGQAIQKGVNGFINQIPMAQRAATNAYIQQNWKQPDVPVTPDVPVDSVAPNPKPSLMSRVGKLLGL